MLDYLLALGIVVTVGGALTVTPALSPGRRQPLLDIAVLAVVLLLVAILAALLTL